jgi:hypothetical protein
MKLAIIGSRTLFPSTKCIYNIITKKLFLKIENIETVISGGAKGVDTQAGLFANEYNISLKEIFPNYKKFSSKQAPIIRNTEIVESCDMLLAFWDGFSRGTLDTINKARKSGKNIIIIEKDYIDKENRNE